MVKARSLSVPVAEPMGAALVTGAARRLGRAMVLTLAARGYDVAVHYWRSGKDAQDTVDAARALGVKAIGVQMDFLSSAGTASLVPLAQEALGRPLSLLVNNASIFEPDRISDATPASWERHMSTNVRAPFQLMQSFANQAAPAGASAGETVSSSMIVNMLDQCVSRPERGFATYTLTKFGLWGLTRMAALELAPRIRVNAIAPGPTLRAERQSASHFAQQRRASPLERGAHPDEVASALAYLIDSPSVTGQVLHLDGGGHLASYATDL